MSNSPAGHVNWPDRFDDAPLSSPVERRKHARKKLAFLTAVLLDPGSNSPATVVDLSEGGVGVRSGLPLQQGAICRLQLSAPDSNQVIDAACELAWNRAPHAGFRFSILTEKSQRQIKEWLTVLDEAHGQAPAASTAIANENLTATAPIARVSNLLATPQGEELAAISDQALLSLAMQARDLTKANGAAVAINDGSGIVCRASLGSAPDVGVRIQPDRGLSGECLRTGEIVVCYDAENDPRVDPSVSRLLNMRSAVIVPIGRHETPAGLVEVFFGESRAFNEAAVYALQELATAFLIASEPAPAIPNTEPARAAGSLPQMACFNQREAAPGFVICDVCGQENNERNRVCDKCDVPLPAALRYVDLNSPEDGENSGFRAQPIRSEQSQPSHRGSYRKKLLLMLLVAVLVAAWQVRGKMGAEPPIVIPMPKMIIEVPALRDKAPEPPLREAAPTKSTASTKAAPAKKTAGKNADPTEPEVVLRTFPIQTKAPSKTGDKKPSSQKKSTLTSSTIPEAVDLAQRVADSKSAATQRATQTTAAR